LPCSVGKRLPGEKRSVTVSGKKSRRRGRPAGTSQKLTLALQENIFAALRIGLAAKHAAEKEGVPERTFYDWLRKGEQGIEPYRSFALGVMRAAAEGAAYVTARMLTGGPGAAQAAWLLERRFPREYGLQSVNRTAPDEEDRLRQSLDMAKAVRSNPKAIEKINEAILLAMADAPAKEVKRKTKRKPKPKRSP
jgi:hypothetical protein